MIINPYIFAVAASYDSDALAFFTATGITDVVEKDAVNQLVLDLKSYSLWSKFIAIYPLVGGSATTHKYNLKNPVDSDAAYRLTFYGGVTHDANGITGNGTTGAADTYIVASSVLSQNDCSAFIYIRTNAGGGYVDMGSIKSSVPQYRTGQMNPRNGSNLFTTSHNDNTVSTSTASSDSRGFWGVSRQASGSYKQTVGTTQTTISITSTGLNSEKIALMALGAVGASFANYSPRNMAFAAVGTGLTDTECDDLYTIVQAYQTALSRNV